MALIIIILGVAAPLCLVVMVLGCLNCFMKRKPGFSPFSNPNFVEEGTAGRHNDAFTVDMTPSISGNAAIEPLPDMTASKPATLPPLRPKFVCVDKDNEDTALSFLGSHRPFLRQHLTYLNPLGTGWFGQVILTEALRITTDSLKSQVIVKILNDEASEEEEKQFIEEIMPFRRLDHPNVMALLGQCTESKPYLVILEQARHGNLKSFLQSHKQNMDLLLKKDKLLHFGLNVAAGVACIHRHNFAHCDLATRNCLVMGDYTIKIGDYGLAEHNFKEDYLQSKKEFLPIRWMAPECLLVDEGNSLSSQNFTKASDMWSFGVLLWEIFSFAERPYNMLTDEAVLQGVVLDKVVSLADVPHKVPHHERLYGLINECCRDESERIGIEAAHQVLEALSKSKAEKIQDDDLDFDQKWNHLIPNTDSRTQSMISEDGSGIALAGSFSSEATISIGSLKRSSQIVDRSGEVHIQPVTSDTVSKEVVTKVLLAEKSHQPAVVEEKPKAAVPVATKLVENETADATPSKHDTKNSSKDKMPPLNTSTPLAEKSAQNTTSTTDFLTALDISSSQYTTAQEELTTDNSLLDIGGSDSQSLTTLGFESSPVEEKKTVPELDTDKIDIPTGDNSSSIQKVSAEVEDNTELSVGSSKLELSSPPNVVSNEEIGSSPFDDFNMLAGGEMKDEKVSTKTNEIGFDFGSFDDMHVNQTVKDSGLSSPSESTKASDLDTSFDVLVPSMLNSPTTTTNKEVIQSAAGDGSTPTADAVTSNIFLPATAEATTSPQDIANTPDAVPEIETIANQLPEVHQSGDNSLFETNVVSAPSSNPFSSVSANPFFATDTSSSPFNDALVVNKPDMDASSSLNSSSLLAWDTSVPEGESTPPPVKEEESGPSNDLDRFLFVDQTGGLSKDPSEKSSPVSSDFSFVEFPAASADLQKEAGDDAMDPSLVSSGLDITTTTPPVTDIEAPTTTPANNQLDDIFGLTSPPAQSDPGPPQLGGASEPATSNPPISADPFDMFDSSSPFAMDSKSSPPEGDKVDDSQKNASFDFLGLDPFSSISVAPASNAPPNLMQGGGGDLVFDTLSSSSTANQVGSVYKYDDDGSCPENSREESGINCQSVADSLTIPNTTAATSDSCYGTGVSVVNETKSVEATSEEISDDQTSPRNSTESNSKEEEEEEEEFDDRSKVRDRLLGEELFLKLQEHHAANVSRDNSDDNISDNEDTTTTTDSDSEREYICVNPFDTGQPPTTTTMQSGAKNNKENVDPISSPDMGEIAFEDLNEHDLRIVSEIYLSKGVKSPRVFQVPPLETIPENHPLHCVSEEVAPPTPSETSSIGPRDDDIFGSDGFEWDDDFYGNALIGKDDAVSPELDDDHNIPPSSLIGNHNISNWSVDFEADSQLSCASSSLMSCVSGVSGPSAMNRSDSACRGNNDGDKSSISDQNVRCLSDSELLASKSSKVSSRPGLGLVASTLAKHRNNHSRYSSPSKSSKTNGNFYTLMEDFDFPLDSSQDENSCVSSDGDDDNYNNVDNVKKSPSHNSRVSPPTSPSFSHSIPPSLHPSSHSLIMSPERSADELDTGQAMPIQPKTSPVSSDSNTTSPSSMDLLGLGFDTMTPSNNGANNGVSETSPPKEVENSHTTTTTTTSLDDPFDFSFN